mgnify:FL=1
MSFCPFINGDCRKDCSFYRTTVALGENRLYAKKNCSLALLSEMVEQISKAKIDELDDQKDHF